MIFCIISKTKWLAGSVVVLADEELCIFYAELAMAVGGFEGNVPMGRAEVAKDRVGSEADARTQAVTSDTVPMYAAVAHVASLISTLAAVHDIQHGYLGLEV